MPKTILLIDSSPLGERSVSRKFTAKLAADLKARNPDSKLVTRDLAAQPLPHLNNAVIGAFYTPPEKRDSALVEAVKLSDQAVDELMGADIVVIGAPMWNFGIPSVLKAWIDHVVRAGKTFKYGETGPVGLATGKKMIIVSSRGGVYSQGPMQPLDHQETYLKSVLGFIGITDISFIRAEGVAMGEDAVKKAMATAESQLADALKNVA